MIPKIIHYCWFGKNKKSEDIQNCINSWKKFFPDWKIIEWNEDNYNINKHQYTIDAYNAKKWAFVSDVARLEILYEYGGIYLDVDVEFINELPSNILDKVCFMGFEPTGLIAPGLIFGCDAKNPFIKQIIELYKDERFYEQSNGIYNTINLRITNFLCDKGLEKIDKFQEIDNVTVYPSEYFCGYDTDIMEPKITQNTICWHHYLGSWSKITKKKKTQILIKRILGIKVYRLILITVRVIRGNVNAFTRFFKN